MTARIHENSLKGIFFIILFIVLTLQSIIAGAQSYRTQNSDFYRGFVASFGTRSADISSSIAKIDQTTLMQAGGQIGLMFGNAVLRSKIGLLGYYSSVGTANGTTDLYESNAAVNFYPLSWLMKKSLTVEPYLAGGLHYDQYKFYGHYVNREPGETNYSQTEAPYLGKIKQVNATVALGVEVRLVDDVNFIHLFSEVRYGGTLSDKATNETFANTQLTNQMQVVLGVTFGAHR